MTTDGASTPMGTDTSNVESPATVAVAEPAVEGNVDDTPRQEPEVNGNDVHYKPKQASSHQDRRSRRRKRSKSVDRKCFGVGADIDSDAPILQSIGGRRQFVPNSGILWRAIRDFGSRTWESEIAAGIVDDHIALNFDGNMQRMESKKLDTLDKMIINSMGDHPRGNNHARLPKPFLAFKARLLPIIWKLLTGASADTFNGKCNQCQRTFVLGDVVDQRLSAKHPQVAVYLSDDQFTFRCTSCGHDSEYDLRDMASTRHLMMDCPRLMFLEAVRKGLPYCAPGDCTYLGKVGGRNGTLLHEGIEPAMFNGFQLDTHMIRLDNPNRKDDGVTLMVPLPHTVEASPQIRRAAVRSSPVKFKEGQKMFYLLPSILDAQMRFEDHSQLWTHLKSDQGPWLQFWQMLWFMNQVVEVAEDRSVVLLPGKLAAPAAAVMPAESLHWDFRGPMETKGCVGMLPDGAAAAVFGPFASYRRNLMQDGVHLSVNVDIGSSNFKADISTAGSPQFVAPQVNPGADSQSSGGSTVEAAGQELLMESARPNVQDERTRSTAHPQAGESTTPGTRSTWPRLRAMCRAAVRLFKT